ncbi:alpha/beta fold hydrolase [Bacillus massiliglaciei]|uniref:alpha/beta fold hydrolase n=1 Tax=Bacillus massiliglaciei TaxID=1816693 RepID=UPI000DA5FC15|nr:alpha/beta hydrolase [Bacillus massiliglaciei]
MEEAEGGGKMNKFIPLKDGRKIGYREAGMKDGIPLFVCHSTEGTGQGLDDVNQLACHFGVRLIELHRPGYGLSADLKGREPLDFAEKVIECAQYLRLKGYFVLGISGGGIYALACAYVCPEKVMGAILFPGFGAFSTAWRKKHPKRAGQFFSKYFAALSLMTVKSQFKRIYKRRPGERSNTVSELDEEIKEMQKEYEQAVTSVMYESRMLQNAWEIPLKKIAVPVEIYEYRKFRGSSILSAQQQKQLPDVRVHKAPGESRDLWSHKLSHVRTSSQAGDSSRKESNSEED